MSWPTEIGGQGLPERLRRDRRRGAGRRRRAAPAEPRLPRRRASSSTATTTSSSGSCPGIVNGRDRWCQGFSEPDAGSDLAVAAHPRRPRRRRVRPHRPQGLDELLRRRRLVPRARPHRPRRAQAQGHLRLRRARCDQPGIEQRPLRMINGITKEFGEVIFDGARVPAANMIGEPGEGWRAGHDRRQPRARAGRARLRRPLPQAGQGAHRAGAATSPTRFGAEQRARPRRGRSSRPRCCGCTCSRRLSDRLDGIAHGPEGSVDKLLMT